MKKIILFLLFIHGLYASTLLQRAGNYISNITKLKPTSLMQQKRTLIPDSVLVQTMPLSKEAPSLLDAELQRSTVEQMFKDSKQNKWTEWFFGLSPEHVLHDTRRPLNPLKSATQEDLGRFVDAIKNNSTSSFIEEPIVQEWWQRHIKTCDKLHDFKDFKRKLKEIISNAKKQPLEDVQNNFALLAHLKGHTAEDAQQFYKGLGISFNPTQETAALRSIIPKDIASLSKQELEQEFTNAFLTLKSSTDLSFLSTPSIHAGYKSMPSAPLCVEESLRTLLQTILYDPATKQFTLSKLPSHLHVSDRLKQFITTHANPHQEGYYKKSAEDWLATVSDVPHVQYRRINPQGSYEIASTTHNGLTVLNELLGTNASTFEQLGEQLSTKARTISIQQRNANYYSTNIKDNNYHASGSIHFMPGHATFALDQAAKNALTLEQGAYLADLSQALHTKHSLLELVKKGNLFKFFEDAQETKQFDKLKKILESRKWNLNIEVNRYTLLQKAIKSDKPIFNLFFDHLHKYHPKMASDLIEVNYFNRFLTDKYHFFENEIKNIIAYTKQHNITLTDNSLINAFNRAANYEAISLILKAAKERNIIIPAHDIENCFNKKCPYLLSQEALESIINYVQYYKLPVSNKIIFTEPLLEGALESKAIPFLLKTATENNYVIPAQAINKYLKYGRVIEKKSAAALTDYAKQHNLIFDNYAQEIIQKAHSPSLSLQPQSLWQKLSNFFSFNNR